MPSVTTKYYSIYDDRCMLVEVHRTPDTGRPQLFWWLMRYDGTWMDGTEDAVDVLYKGSYSFTEINAAQAKAFATKHGGDLNTLPQLCDEQHRLYEVALSPVNSPASGFLTNPAKTPSDSMETVPRGNPK